jgi:putative protease
MNRRFPQILAPAGDMQSFLAALSAGADAVYVGLKHFSARMQAANFSLDELAAMKRMAERRDVRLYVAMNTLVKPGDADAAGRLIDRLNKTVAPDAIILQDLGMAALARQVGFSGELHLSTLANVSQPAALVWLREKLGMDRVILPRELSIDEIKACAEACPQGLSLELFVHGALCYAVSGRCYWSSYLGGKSGLRGRCVQPCRRRYQRKGQPGRLFSCRDLHLDVLVKTLLDVPEVAAWKIEGRKKGPHYVFYVTSAYRLLRDEGATPDARKQAQDLLEQALSRPGTHYNFLPQRKQVPVNLQDQTGSGQLVARVPKGGEGTFAIKPRVDLLPGDLLRVGYEDEPWHQMVKVPRRIPRNGTFDVKPTGKRLPKPGTDIFLVDRREPELIARLKELEKELAEIKVPGKAVSGFSPRLPSPVAKRGRPRLSQVYRRLPMGRIEGEAAVWLRPGMLREVNRTLVPRLWWWLPPVIWPDEEAEWMRAVTQLVTSGGKRLVLNAPWQMALLESLRRKSTEIWAGPFCNLANPLALQELKRLGFSGAIVSPELAREDMLELGRQSPLPLGMVMEGLWPLCVSRTLAEDVKPNEPLTSPMGEIAWVRRHGQNVWVYPGWPVDLSAHRSELEAAGYELFVRLNEPLPANVRSERSASSFNWELTLY